MKFIYVCNSASDYISKVDLENLKQNKITLSNKFGRVGPHGLSRFEKSIIVANCFSNSISIVDLTDCREKENIYIGNHCTDVKVFNGKAYVACGDTNNIVIFDLKNKMIVEEVPTGNHPHNIDINKKGILAVANMESDNVVLIDCENKEYFIEVKVAPYPFKVKFSRCGCFIYVCESNLGSDKTGSISIISVKNKNVIKRIEVGKGPVDICVDINKGYVCNFVEGSISIVDIKSEENTKKIDMGGMPRAIVKNEKYIYIVDSYNNTLLKCNLVSEENKIISLGKEPSEMILF